MTNTIISEHPHIWRSGRICAAALIGALMPACAAAGVVVEGTRVIYPSAKREVAVTLHNEGASPSLVQAWIDAGQAEPAGPRDPVPFVITPAIFRLDPKKGQTLRILFAGKPLPSDRETVFWLNVLDVPPKAPVNPDAPNQLNVAFRHRLKVFYRPAQLTQSSEESARKVSWALANAGGRSVLTATNPTPFHVSFTRLSINGPVASAVATPGMVGPFSSATFALETKINSAAAPSQLTYGFVNDFGAVIEGEARIGAGNPSS